MQNGQRLGCISKAQGFAKTPKLFLTYYELVLV